MAACIQNKLSWYSLLASMSVLLVAASAHMHNAVGRCDAGRVSYVYRLGVMGLCKFVQAGA